MSCQELFSFISNHNYNYKPNCIVVEICEICCVVWHIVDFNTFQVFSNYWLQFPYTSVRSSYSKDLFKYPKFIFAFFLSESTN